MLRTDLCGPKVALELAAEEPAALDLLGQKAIGF